MITIKWSLLVLIALILGGFIWVFTLNNEQKVFGSQRGWGCLVWIIITMFLVIVYGGIFWW